MANVIEVKVEGMTCGNCARRVENALLELRGVLRADVDLASGRARIHPGKIAPTIEEIEQKIAKAGYVMAGGAGQARVS